MNARYHLRRHEDRAAMQRLGNEAAHRWCGPKDHPRIRRVVDVHRAADAAFSDAFSSSPRDHIAALCDDSGLGRALFVHSFISFITALIETHDHYATIWDKGDVQ